MSKQRIQDVSRDEIVTELAGTTRSNELLQTSALLRIADALEAVAATVGSMHRRQTHVESRQVELERKLTSMKGSVSRLRKEVDGASA